MHRWYEMEVDHVLLLQSRVLYRAGLAEQTEARYLVRSNIYAETRVVFVDADSVQELDGDLDRWMQVLAPMVMERHCVGGMGYDIQEWEFTGVKVDEPTGEGSFEISFCVSMEDAELDEDEPEDGEDRPRQILVFTAPDGEAEHITFQCKVIDEHHVPEARLD